MKMAPRVNRFAMTPGVFFTDPFFLGHPGRLVIFQHLLARANLSTRTVELSTPTLSRLTGIERTAIRRALNSLEKNGFIGKLKLGKTNMYQILKSECFNSKENANNTRPPRGGLSLSNGMQGLFPDKAQLCAQVEPKSKLDRPYRDIVAKENEKQRLIINSEANQSNKFPNKINDVNSGTGARSPNYNNPSYLSVVRSESNQCAQFSPTLNPKINTKPSLSKSLSHNFSGDGEWWGVGEVLKISEEEFDSLPAKEIRRLKSQSGIFSDKFFEAIKSGERKRTEQLKYSSLKNKFGWWQVLKVADYIFKNGTLREREPVLFVFSYLEVAWDDALKACNAFYASKKIDELKETKKEIENRLAEEGQRRFNRASEEFEQLPNAEKIKILEISDQLVRDEPEKLISAGIVPANYSRARAKNGDGLTRMLVRVWLTGLVPGTAPSFISI